MQEERSNSLSSSSSNAIKLLRLDRLICIAGSLVAGISSIADQSRIAVERRTASSGYWRLRVVFSAT